MSEKEVKYRVTDGSERIDTGILFQKYFCLNIQKGKELEVNLIILFRKFYNSKLPSFTIFK